MLSIFKKENNFNSKLLLETREERRRWIKLRRKTFNFSNFLAVSLYMFCLQKQQQPAATAKKFFQSILLYDNQTVPQTINNGERERARERKRETNFGGLFTESPCVSVFLLFARERISYCPFQLFFLFLFCSALYLTWYCYHALGNVFVGDRGTGR